MSVSVLFSPLRLRSLNFRNRIFVSPMCQYSAVDGVPNDWHFVHLGSRATGGAALVIAEATGVAPEGRISPGDTGIWNEAQEKAFARIAAFVKSQGAAAGIQLAHAGRKASCSEPWNGDRPLKPEEGAWQTLAPSAIPFGPDWHVPKEMSEADIGTVVRQFAEAARRSLRAGFQVA